MRISFTPADLSTAADILINRSTGDGVLQIGVTLMLVADAWNDRVMVNRPAPPRRKLAA